MWQPCKEVLIMSYTAQLDNVTFGMKGYTRRLARGSQESIQGQCSSSIFKPESHHYSTISIWLFVIPRACVCFCLSVRVHARAYLCECDHLSVPPLSWSNSFFSFF